MTESRDKSRGGSPSIWTQGLIAGALIVAATLAYGLGMPRLWGCPTNPGSWGDMFGGLNALFSGLALGAVVLSLLAQRRELLDQQEDLKEQRQALLRTAEAQEKSAKVLEALYQNVASAGDPLLLSERANPSDRGKHDPGFTLQVELQKHAPQIKGLPKKDFENSDWKFQLVDADERRIIVYARPKTEEARRMNREMFSPTSKQRESVHIAFAFVVRNESGIDRRIGARFDPADGQFQLSGPSPIDESECLDS